MADKQISTELSIGVKGRESIVGLADDLDGVAKVLDGEMKTAATAAAAQLRVLAQQDAAIKAFSALESEVREAGRALKSAETEAANYAAQVGRGALITKQETDGLVRLQAQVRAAKDAYEQSTSALKGAQAELTRFGISAKDVGAAQQRLQQQVTMVREAVQELVPAHQNAAAGAAAAGESMVRTHRRIGDGVDSISLQLARMQKLFVAIQGLSGFKAVALDLAETADQVNNLQSRLKLVVGEGENFARSWQGVTEVALRTHSALEETGTLFSRLAQAGKDAGQSTADAVANALGLTETINQAIQLSGASAQASSAAITQLVQGLQGGVLRGDEFNSIMEQSPRLARALADGLGVTTGELRKMAEAGLLTSDTVIKALQGQSDTVASEFSKLPPTVGRALQDLSTQWALYVADTDKATGASSAAASAISALSNNLRTIGGLLMDAGQAVAAFTALRLAQHFLGIGTAATASAAATAASTAATVANTGATTANAVAKAANTAATNANAAANAAAALSTNRFAGAFSGLGAQVRAVSGVASTATATAGRFAALLGGLPTLALVAIAANFKDIGTWIGESVAKLAGYKDRTEELARAEQLQAQIAKEAAADRARLAASIQAAIDKQFELSKAARSAVAEFEQLTKNGTLAADAIKKVTEGFDLGKVQGVKDFTATIDKLAADGKLAAGEFEAAWAQALNGKDLAQFEVLARSAFGGTVDAANKASEAVRVAIAAGVTGAPLEELQAKAALALGAVGRDGERIAQVMDGVLREAVRRSGLEFEVLQGRIGAAARSSINDLEAIIGGLDRLKEQGVDTGRVLNASISKAIDTADSQAALDAVRAQIERVRTALGDKMADGLLDQAARKAEELRAKLDAATGGINSVAEAMGKLGMKSIESLRQAASEAQSAYGVIKAAGQQEGESYLAWQLRKQEAARAMLQRMIEANGGVADAATRARAAAEGLKLGTDESGRTIVNSMRDAKRAVEDVGDAAERAGKGFHGMAQEAANAANSTKRLHEIQDRHRLDAGDPNKSDIDNLYDRSRMDSWEEGEKKLNKSRSEVSGNAALIKEYVDAEIAKQWGEQFIGDSDAVEAFNVKLKLEAYRNNYGNVVRSQESLNEQHGLLQTLQRLEEKLRARQAEGQQKASPKQDEATAEPAASRTTGSTHTSSTHTGSSTGGGGVSYVSNITLQNGQRKSVRFADADSQATNERLLRDLAAAKGVAQ